MLERCQEAQPTDVSFPRAKWSRRLDWWPDKLDDGNHELAISSLTMWRCDRTVRLASGPEFPVDAYLGINHESDTVFYWEQ